MTEKDYSEIVHIIRTKIDSIDFKLNLIHNAFNYSIIS